uniref:Uncharacterized protein n=1 Tax=Poecilia mexicana TaxID=48701 RepID=A0A3B3YQE5_9TELE
MQVSFVPPLHHHLLQFILTLSVCCRIRVRPLLFFSLQNGLSPLHMATQGDHLNCVQLLLHHEVPVDDDDQTPLHISSRLGKPDIVQHLLTKGACPDNGYTPLHIAAKKNQMEIATTLLEYGASTSTVTRQGITPLHLAAQEGNVDVVTLLLARDAPVGTSNKVTLTRKSENAMLFLPSATNKMDKLGNIAKRHDFILH